MKEAARTRLFIAKTLSRTVLSRAPRVLEVIPDILCSINGPPYPRLLVVGATRVWPRTCSDFLRFFFSFFYYYIYKYIHTYIYLYTYLYIYLHTYLLDSNICNKTQLIPMVKIHNKIPDILTMM